MATKNTCLGGERSAMLLKNAKRVVFVGIGGVGMCSIAHILLCERRKVMGQDTGSNQYTEQLVRQGATVEYHDLALPLEAGDVVVYTAAVSPNHPTLEKARAMQIPLLSRADALAGIMQETHPRIAIAGMHGKSTTTALLGHILAEANLAPTVVCGAEMAKENAPYLLGAGPFVFEACEYMASFLSFTPDVSLLLNMEWEHIDCYPKMEDVECAFSRFAHQSKSLVLSYDEMALRPFAKQNDALFYSLCDERADVYGKNITAEHGGYRFTLCQKQAEIGEVSLSLVGKMNVSNAIAAAAVALRLGVSPQIICESLSKDKGVKRRLEHRGFLGKTPVFDDYAHHPTEISASLSALRSVTRGKLYAVFQSHTYSRTKAFFSPLTEALRLADTVLVADIYPARESDTLGMSGKGLAEGIGEKACYCEDFSQMAAYLTSCVKEDDTVVVMGAGNIDRLFSHLPLSPRPV